MPAPDGSDDFVRVGGPGEGLWVVVCLSEEALDAGLEVDDRAEDAAFEAAFGQLGEEALDSVEPGCRSWGPAGVPCQPLAHLRMLMGCVVVDDGVDRLSRRDLRFDDIEEADELLMTMALHASADDFAFEHVESGEQRRRAVALVIMRHRSSAALLHRQARPSAVERLDLRLLIDREHDRMGGSGA